MTITNRVLISLVAAAFVTAVFYAGSLFTKPVFGSVQVSSEYVATTTFAASSPVVRVLRSGPGTLGQVTITGANTGFITIYNATTSDVTQRAASMSSSSQLIADFPASAAAGTYTFDASANVGLLLVTSGLTATSTITYR